MCIEAVRCEDGAWLCRAIVKVVTSQGPLTMAPGVIYRKGRPIQGCDVARWLDDRNDSRIEPVAVQFL